MTRENECKGIFAKVGGYDGTYAYKDIAFKFGMYIAPDQAAKLAKMNKN